MADPATCQGQSFVGQIKFYSNTRGYGFIVSEQVEGDLFFFHRNLSREVIDQVNYESCDLRGKGVSFTVGTTPEGKWGAVDIHLEYPRSHQVLDDLEPGSFKGGGKKGMGKWGGWGWGGGYDPYGMGMGMMMGGKGKGMGKKGGMHDHSQPGTPLTEERIQGTMKSYSNGSKWGFATSQVGEYGDIFVHMNNLHEDSPDICLREGDIIEMDLEEINGKPVAKRVTLIAQDASTYTGQFVKGIVTSYDDSTGAGSLSAPRIIGELPFHKDDCAPCMEGNYVDAEVMCRVVVGTDGKPRGVNVNPLWGMEYAEGQLRSQEIIDALSADGFIDDTAKKTLYPTEPNELLSILPDLDLVKSKNPSSLVIGALSRQRFEDWENYGPMMWYKGKGDGKGDKGGMGMW